MLISLSMRKYKEGLFGLHFGIYVTERAELYHPLRKRKFQTITSGEKNENI